MKISVSAPKTDLGCMALMRDLAEAHGGSLVTTEWQGVKFNYEFLFPDGTPLFMKFANILTRQRLGQSGWPLDPKYYAKYLKTAADHLKELSDLAVKRGGVLLSDTWKGVDAYYEFRDSGGHIFSAKGGPIKSGQWSPHEGLVSEPLCRQIMEHFFKHPFPLAPRVAKVMENGKERRFDLDGYCPKLGIAFEYQGFPAHWKPTHPHYEKTSIRDKLKRQWCEEKGVALVIIPHLRQSAARYHIEHVMDHVKTSISNAFAAQKKAPPLLNEEEFVARFTDFCVGKKHLDRLKTIAENANGKLLSTVWIGHKNYYQFLTSEGREISGRADFLFRKGWFVLEPYTGAERMEIMRKTATDNGGQMLSTEWEGPLAQYRFTFSDGREFSITWSQLQPGQRKRRRGGWPRDNGRHMRKNGPKAV